ncbi:hypothetical protein [Lapillicoccus jejuensis]|uniref:Uncharacterized protein n=1 Tax=Lapillicoccus jejuensis TaxID=402171 RepID=A0A542E2W8_9MICO|nr:hypothetical protein [Lapillicoccus jejuensis]TQJ09673.1 hypothetical protein FB458_2786 [Lapillicoccus jejuensis]
MSGASTDTLRVDYVNANWTPGPPDRPDGPGTFELLVVTEDGERRTLPLATQDASAVLALVEHSDVLLLDPQTSTLIAGNLAGQWFQPGWTRGARREPGPAHGR